MKVRELIEILNGYSPDHEVLITDNDRGDCEVKQVYETCGRPCVVLSWSEPD